MTLTTDSAGEASIAGDAEANLNAGSGAKLNLVNNAESSGAIVESVHLLDGGAKAYPRMLLAIAQARKAVHLEVYAFAPSGVGARFIEALSDAASRGVSVQVLIDGWGSARGGGAVAAALRQAGCTVRIYSRLRALLIGHFWRNHRKILLVDNTVAFIGGINIGDENLSDGLRLGWADLALEIRGVHSARLGEMIRHEPWRSVEQFAAHIPVRAGRRMAIASQVSQGVRRSAATRPPCARLLHSRPRYSPRHYCCRTAGSSSASAPRRPERCSVRPCRHAKPISSAPDGRRPDS